MYAMLATIDQTHLPTAPHKASEQLNLEFKKLALPINGPEMHKAPLSEEEEEEEEENDEDDENQCKNVIEYPKDDSNEFSVDPRDVGTSDSWIKRNPNLIRLTGRHPFNSEPPVDLLMSHGFLTPTSLHYVRNHGYVPKAESLEQWTIEVSGLVAKPRTFTMAEIMADFTPAEIPVTLVCAGNRRKEQNMVRQTIGFNWGPGGIGTSMWRGARLSHILRRCGIETRKNRQKSSSKKSSSSSSRVATHVCFEGRERLPGGGAETTPYGTSISLDVALDESCDVLVAYMQNRKLLEPDHGFPARMIIPGYIGGRMVKWLTRITVTGKESENHYHFKDNRVLPSHVDAEKANAEGWWYKPEYIINELNINSVITTPSHDQIVPIDANTLQVPFRLEGYAYSGGGRKVTRVEVTLDDGGTWMLSEITHPERPTVHGRYWCWCFWRLDVDLIQLIQAKELAVRAWDSSMNTQPQTLTWNLMGMMNNCWFRVKINPCKATGNGGIGLAFEHPTQPGNQGGGWMIPANKVSSSNDQQHTSSKVLGKSLSSPGLNPGGFEHRHITDAELKRHNTRESAWISVHNNVYDCTKFLKEHPGGSDSILINAGTDCTEEFDAIHSTKAKAMLEDFKIGEMVSIGDSSILTNGVNMPIVPKHVYPLSPISESRPIALNPTQKIKVKLASNITLSHDVRLLRFELPSKEHILGLPVGKHIFLSAMIDGKLCLRAYTPVSSNDDVGYFELLVKVYFKGVHPKFPDGGLMSQYLDSLQVGEDVEVKGPLGHIEYIGNGNYMQEGQHYYMKKCAMMAGGTGITPIYQLIRAILNDPSDTTEIYLVFANRTESDIMLRSELENWAKEHLNFKLWYVVERAHDNGTWPYSLGFINENILEKHLPEASPETSTFMCGPPPMIKFACLPNLEKMGYNKSRCHQF